MKFKALVIYFICLIHFKAVSFEREIMQNNEITKFYNFIIKDLKEKCSYCMNFIEPLNCKIGTCETNIIFPFLNFNIMKLELIGFINPKNDLKLINFNITNLPNFFEKKPDPKADFEAYYVYKDDKDVEFEILHFGKKDFKDKAYEILDK